MVEVKKTLQLVLRDLGEYASLKERASGPVASALLIVLFSHTGSSERIWDVEKSTQFKR